MARKTFILAARNLSQRNKTYELCPHIKETTSKNIKRKKNKSAPKRENIFQWRQRIFRREFSPK